MKAKYKASRYFNFSQSPNRRVWNQTAVLYTQIKRSIPGTRCRYEDMIWTDSGVVFPVCQRGCTQQTRKPVKRYEQIIVKSAVLVIDFASQMRKKMKGLRKECVHKQQGKNLWIIQYDQAEFPDGFMDWAVHLSMTLYQPNTTQPT